MNTLIIDEAEPVTPPPAPAAPSSRRSWRRFMARKRGVKFERQPGSRKPFRRVHEYHKQFIDLIAATAGMLPIDREMALRALPPYVSRGHGGRHRPTQRIVGSKQFQDRSKYLPAEEDTKHLRAPSDHMVAKQQRRRSVTMVGTQ